MAVRPLIVTTLLSVAVGPAVAQVSPYAGAGDRAIKALSAEEVAAYLAGEGMGLAMAAELNSYPGPRHVLELSDSLRLTPEQRAGARELFGRMSREAQRLGAEVVALEARLDSSFAGGTVTRERLAQTLDAIAAAQGALRFVHLSAHLEMRAMLTPRQVAHYDMLRGYGGSHHEHRD